MYGTQGRNSYKRHLRNRFRRIFQWVLDNRKTDKELKILIDDMEKLDAVIQAVNNRVIVSGQRTAWRRCFEWLVK